MSFCWGVSSQNELSYLIKRSGENSVPVKAYRLLHLDSVQNFLMLLLLIDCAVTIGGLVLKEHYPDCGIILRDSVSCCISSNASQQGYCAAGYAEVGQAECDPDKHPGAVQLEIGLWIASITLINVFLLEMTILFLILRALFLTNCFYILDTAIVTTSLVLEVTLGDPTINDKGGAVGLLLFARRWRLLRIAAKALKVAHMRSLELKESTEAKEHELSQYRQQMAIEIDHTYNELTHSRLYHSPNWLRRPSNLFRSSNLLYHTAANMTQTAAHMTHSCASLTHSCASTCANVTSATLHRLNSPSKRQASQSDLTNTSSDAERSPICEEHEPEPSAPLHLDHWWAAVHHSKGAETTARLRLRFMLLRAVRGVQRGTITSSTGPSLNKEMSESEFPEYADGKKSPIQDGGIPKCGRVARRTARPDELRSYSVVVKSAAFERVDKELMPVDLDIPETLCRSSSSVDVSSFPGAECRYFLALDPASVNTPQRVLDQTTRLRRACSRLRDPSYSLREYHSDLHFCFPELRLYLAVDADAKEVKTTGGLTSHEEYKRTIGAAHAVYWLMRLDLHGTPGVANDGQRGFSFGVDSDWNPPSAEVCQHMQRAEPGTMANKLTPLQKRLLFYDTMDWMMFQRLLIDAGMLVQAADGAITIGIDRCVAMLTLTAIHDIMKLPTLLPVVQKAHAPYNGYAAGSTIRDHDMALAYVLHCDPEALPSYSILSETLRAPIRFTQADLGFNHGWLVQAEAPPGALFSKLKQLISQSQVRASDIAFYFVHWLTDLAGAEPTPLCGMEKFVTKFPQAVLSNLIKSMPVVQRLAFTDETRLMYEYLQESWVEAAQRVESLGPLPQGADAVARMRLVVQAQSAKEQAQVNEAFHELPDDEKAVLAKEMSLSGVPGQRFPGGGIGSPAFLVYYSPAFVRLGATDSARNALRMLAAIYKYGRQLFPDEEEDDQDLTVDVDHVKAVLPRSGDETSDATSSTPEDAHKALTQAVTIHIGEIKMLLPTKVCDAYNEGFFWVLVRTSEKDAVVERWHINSMESLPSSNEKRPYRILPFWRDFFKSSPNSEA
mmetsp:Transcript_13697/g.29033  ORF Transcript_13697/g.29033 Transcript_13697/m.29033 type:complete len:1065 (-) Transcript_13697:456-3650(-)